MNEKKFIDVSDLVRRMENALKELYQGKNHSWSWVISRDNAEDMKKLVENLERKVKEKRKDDKLFRILNKLDFLILQFSLVVDGFKDFPCTPLMDAYDDLNKYIEELKKIYDELKEVKND